MAHRLQIESFMKTQTNEIAAANGSDAAFGFIFDATLALRDFSKVAAAIEAELATLNDPLRFEESIAKHYAAEHFAEILAVTQNDVAEFTGACEFNLVAYWSGYRDTLRRAAAIKPSFSVGA
jgi:hypothetical protein